MAGLTLLMADLGLESFSLRIDTATLGKGTMAIFKPGIGDIMTSGYPKSWRERRIRFPPGQGLVVFKAVVTRSSARTVSIHLTRQRLHIALGCTCSVRTAIGRLGRLRSGTKRKLEFYAKHCIATWELY